MDELLVKEAQGGDKDSFHKVILEIKDEAYRIAFCYLHNEHDSMDAVCDAVEKAYRNIRKLKSSSYFKTWFIRIVINECKLLLRKKGKDILYDVIPSENDSPTASAEDSIDLKEQLFKLDYIDRALIYMKYYLGYTFDEISFTANMPLGTVKTKIYSNLKKLKENLKVKEA